MDRNGIITELENSLDAFQQLVASFDERQINERPFEGSWTPGQVAQHIVMANSGFGEVLNGPVGATDRAPDEQVEKIKNDFLDFSLKMEAPDFIVPYNKEYSKDNLLHALEKMKASVSKAVSDLDLTQTCLAFELPVYGRLTRLEAIYFVIYHTQRHAHQLKRIKSGYPFN
jgi:hypothetical protein